MSTEIAELTKTFNLFIQENTKVITRLEVNQEHLTKAVQDFSNTSKAAIESNIRLESKIVSLKDRAINKLNLVEDSLNETNAKTEKEVRLLKDEVKLIDKRTCLLETINANTVGKEEGKSKAQEGFDKKVTASWTRTIAVISIVLTIVGLLYKITSGE